MGDGKKPPEGPGVDVDVSEADPFAPPPEQDSSIALATPQPFNLPIARAPRSEPERQAEPDQFAPPVEEESAIALATPQPFNLPIARAAAPGEPEPTAPDEFAPPVEADSAIALATPQPFNLPIVRAPKISPEAAARPPGSSQRGAPPPVGPDPSDPSDPPDRPAPVAEAASPAPPGLLQRPAIRVAVAIAIGLLVGFLVSTPYSKRAERRIAQLHADALIAHASEDPRAPSLDFDAARAAGNAALGTIALWLLFGATAAGGWLYFTRR